MFFLAAFCAAFGYALQLTLMASFYRKMDTLSAVAYRGLSLGLSMLPLLLWVPVAHYAAIGSAWSTLLLLWLFTAAGDWTFANTIRYLPVGVATALGNGLITIVSAVIGYLFFHEALSLMQAVLIGLVIMAILSLGFMRTSGLLPADYDVRKGLCNAALTGILLGIAFSMVGGLSRSFHPFLVGYIWELGTGVAGLLMIMARRTGKGAGLAPLSLREFTKLLLAASPTLLGTGLYALSMSLGPLGLATAIISTQMVFTTGLSIVLYKEKLSWRQWVLLLLICGLVMGLKMVSD